MARLRAVVVSQPPGLGGTPVSGHRSVATTNASWTISSAMSMSPKRRTRVATTRPDSSRKIRSSSGASMAGTDRSLVLERTHLDRTHASDGALGRPLERGVEVGCLDDPEAAELLLGLRERTVRSHRFATGGANHCRDLGRVETAAEDPRAGLLEICVDLVHLLERLLLV